MNWREGWTRLPFVGIALAAIAGIVAADSAPLPRIGLLLAGVALCFAVLRRNLTTRCVLVGCCFFALHSWRQTSSPGVLLAGELGGEPQAIAARGEVAGEPTVSPGGVASFPFQLEWIARSGKMHPTNAVVQAYWRGEPQFGDKLQLFGVAEPIRGPRNPGEFDMRARQARRGVYHSLVVRYPENGKLLERGGGNRVLRAAQASRRWMQNALGRGLEDAPDVQGVISSMVLGVRDDNSDEITEQFQQTGTLHLFAVSGLNVAIVAYLLWSAATVVRLPRRWAAAAVIPALFFYAAITGLNTSSLRAATMAAIVLGGFFVDRKVQPVNSLAAAAVIILGVDTNQLFSIGFQLSFAVVAAIIVFADRILKALVRWSEPDPFLPRSLLSRLQRMWLRAWHTVAGGASVSLAAWIGSLLLILSYFYMITPVSLLANLVVVPLAFGVLAVGLISLVLTPVAPWLALVFNQANWSLTSLILATVALLARAPAAHYYMELPRWPSGARGEITVLDVEAGAAVHLRARPRDWLFDAGPERHFNRIVRSYLRFRGVNRLDGVAFTHGDSQHIGAAPALLRAFRPTKILDTSAPDQSTTHKALIDFVDSHRLDRQLCASPGELLLGREVTARVLFPPPGFAARSADDQALVVQLIVANKWRVLLMSDSGEATENLLLRSEADVQSDILVKGQHHSGVSGSAEFIERVAPQLIVATSPEFPEHERVKDEWQAMVEGCGATLFRLDRTGAVTLRFWRDRWEARAHVTSETFRATSR